MATQFHVRQDKPPASTLDSAPCSVASVFCFDSLAMSGETLCKNTQRQLSSGQLRPSRQAPSTSDFCFPFFTPALGGIRCHGVVIEEAQWCRSGQHISSFDSPVTSQPTKIHGSSERLCSIHFSANTCASKLQQIKNASDRFTGPHQFWNSTKPSTPAMLSADTECATLHAVVTLPTQIYLTYLLISHLFLLSEDTPQPTTSAV